MAPKKASLSHFQNTLPEIQIPNEQIQRTTTPAQEKEAGEQVDDTNEEQRW